MLHRPTMDEQPPDPAAALADELRIVAGRLKRRLREQAGRGDLTGSQVAVLARLDRDGPATVSSLARAEAMRPQSMGGIVAALEAAGLVEGAPDPGDGRQTLLSLTERCRSWIREHRAARQDWLLRTIRARLSPDEQAQLAAALPLLTRIVED
jgi:DNA-binding MarR family transcriptional regulator